MIFQVVIIECSLCDVNMISKKIIHECIEKKNAFRLNINFNSNFTLKTVGELLIFKNHSLMFSLILR